MLRALGTKPVQRGSNLPTDFLNLFKDGAVGSDEPFVYKHAFVQRCPSRL